MRHLAALLLLAAAPAFGQVTVVKPNAGAVTISSLYYACWSRDGVRQACIAAGPAKSDYDKVAAYLASASAGVTVFPMVK